MCQPLDYHFHHAVDGKMMIEEIAKNIGNEKCARGTPPDRIAAPRRPAEYKARLFQNYKLPKAKVDKVLGSMRRRVTELHRMKGKLTAYDTGGNSKDVQRELVEAKKKVMQRKKAANKKAAKKKAAKKK
jgi:hypothetical protein